MQHPSFSSPVAAAKMVVRIGFGIALTLIGIAYYQNASDFSEVVGRGLGFLEPLGMLWGYILPGLFIVGGVLIAVGVYPVVGSLVAGIALASVPVGLMLKSVLSGILIEDTLPVSVGALFGLLVYVTAVRGLGGSCCCQPVSAKPMVPAMKPSVPAKATVATKVAKKSSSKKK